MASRVKTNARKIGLMLRDFNYSSACKLMQLERIEKSKHSNSMGLSEESLFSLLPFDAKFSKLFDDVFSLRYLLHCGKDLLPRCYFLVVRRNGEPYVLACDSGNGQAEPLLGAKPASAEEVERLVREVGEVYVRSSACSLEPHAFSLAWKSGELLADDVRLEKAQLMDAISSLGDSVVVEESMNAQEPDLHVGIGNDGVSAPYLLYASLVRSLPCGNWYERNRELCSVDYQGNSAYGAVEGFESILSSLIDIASQFNELEYMGFTLRKLSAGYKIVEVRTGDDLSYVERFTPELEAFLTDKLAERRAVASPGRFLAMASRLFWRVCAERHGFMDYMYKNWVRDYLRDCLDPRFSWREKRWAHKRGFLSYRKAQYDLTDDNYCNCLSDYDYRWLRPLNNIYRKWVWDKVSLRYTLAEYSCYLPEYYFHVVKRGGTPSVLRMPDCPQDLAGDGFDAVLMLLRKTGCLAMKPTVGSHGEGFCCLRYADGLYESNGKAVDGEGLKRFLSERKESYVISEYVEMHASLKRIYDKVACTVRLMVINETGDSPVIMNAYYRIGTSLSGYTDNLGSGGVFAYVDLETGRYYGAERIEHHRIAPCPKHPDTGVLIEGVIPHWGYVKKTIVEICRYIAPLEYLGFDVVVTQEGFKILEINTHQDLHRYPTYGKEVHGYFAHKVALKKAGKVLA